jgi:DNA-binding protein HU-beta
MKPHKPEDVFRAEKERAQTSRNSQHARLLAEAKAAFDKLMAEGQAARKSGRPRKHPLPPLKTSSSTRPPMRPPAPPVAPPKPVVAAAPARVEKPKVAAKAPAKKAAPVKAVKKAAPRSKAKGSSKR